MSFFSELKRRKVFRVGVAYAIVGWLLVQAASIFFPTFGTPDWVMPVFFSLVIFGFPIALILAWAYDITPDGIKTDSAAQASQPVIQTSDRKLIYVLIALVLVVAGFQIADRFTLDSPASVITNSAFVSGPVNRFVYQIPDELTLRGENYNIIAVSPDGRKFVYNTTQGPFLRELGQLGERLIPGIEENSLAPMFSPDSLSLAYQSNFQFKRISLTDAAPVLLHEFDEAENSRSAAGASWGADDQIYLATFNIGIARIPATGGDRITVIEPQSGELLANPRLLPGGDTLLFSSLYGDTWDTAQIVVQSLSTGERKVLIEGGSDARYVSSGHLIYASGDSLLGVPFDIDSLTVSGSAVPLIQGIQRTTRSGEINIDVSDDGSLIYLPEVDFGLRTLVWIDREGREEPINIPSRRYVYAQLSPDGARIALDVRQDENDIWIFDLRREVMQRMTLDLGYNRAPLWSPDGRLAFTRQIGNSEEIYLQAADGSGVAEQVTTGNNNLIFPTGFSPDGSTLFYRAGPDNNYDIYMKNLSTEASDSQALLATAAYETNATLSPDGLWLAYASDESGQFEIYVRPYPDIDTGRTQISVAGGVNPLWSRDGSELFYIDINNGAASTGTGTGSLMAVAIESETDFMPGIPELLFENNFVVTQQGRQTYDVSADGQRFLMIQNDSNTAENEIIIVQNWVEELKRLVPTE